MRNKIFIIYTIMFLFLFGVTAHASEYRQEISVGLKYGASAGNSVTVSSQSGLNVYDAAAGTLLYTAQPGEEVYIEMGSTGFASYNKFDAGGIAKISIQPQGEKLINCDGKMYRGYIYAEKRDNGELLVLNYVGTDDYVSSVLGKEMSYTWPIEALKAQAVCARNFVLTRGSAHKSYGFDVCTSTHCQVYGGVASEHENTRRAVEETKGVLARFNGELVGLYFFATSGGQTEDVENVWGSPYGYLKSVEDIYENPEKASRYKWTVSLTREEIQQKLETAGVNIGTLNNITIDSTSPSGRVTKMTFHASGGEHSVKLEKCRSILGLYSQKFTVSSDSVSALATTSGSASAPYFAQSASGIGGVAGYSVLYENGKMGTVKVNEGSANNYTINGNGYGHGVGMSQWGARGMAENGFTYDQILKHYFTDIELR